MLKHIRSQVVLGWDGKGSRLSLACSRLPHHTLVPSESTTALGHSVWLDFQQTPPKLAMIHPLRFDIFLKVHKVSRYYWCGMEWEAGCPLPVEGCRTTLMFHQSLLQLLDQTIGIASTSAHTVGHAASLQVWCMMQSPSCPSTTRVGWHGKQIVLGMYIVVTHLIHVPSESTTAEGQSDWHCFPLNPPKLAMI